MKKAVFLDRDGVINQNVSKLGKPEMFKMLSGVPEAIKKLNGAGFLVVIVTNQPDISKGFYTFSDLEKVHARMKKELAAKGAHIDAIYICPHHPEKGFPGEVAELKMDCDCRKPKPGLILKAQKELNLNSNLSWMIGDSLSDIQAGKEAGVKTILLASGGGSGSKQELELKNIKPDYIKKDLLEAVNFILSTI